MHASRRSMLAATALVLTGLAQAADPTELNFGIIATERPAHSSRCGSLFSTT